MNDLKPLDNLTIVSIQSKDFALAYKSLIETIKELEEIKEGVQNKIIELYKENIGIFGVKTFESPDIKFTYTPAGVTKRFDSVCFKQENPEDYEYYVKETPTKEKLTITIKKEKENEC